MSEYTPTAPAPKANPLELLDAAGRAYALLHLLDMAIDHPSRTADSEYLCHIIGVVRDHLDFIVSARLAEYEDTAVPFDVDDVDVDDGDSHD